MFVNPSSKGEALVRIHNVELQANITEISLGISRQPNRSHLPPQRGDKGHPFLQYMPKGSPWGPNTMLQKAEKNWAAPQRTGGVNVFEEGQSTKPGPGSQIGAVCPRKEETRDIHSFNICPKASHGAQIQCCNRQRRIGPHHNIQEEQTSFSKRARVPNMAQAAKLETFAPV